MPAIAKSYFITCSLSPFRRTVIPLGWTNFFPKMKTCPGPRSPPPPLIEIYFDNFHPVQKASLTINSTYSSSVFKRLYREELCQGSFSVKEQYRMGNWSRCKFLAKFSSNLWQSVTSEFTIIKRYIVDEHVQPKNYLPVWCQRLLENEIVNQTCIRFKNERTIRY